MIKHFKFHEFNCPCCNKEEMNMDFLIKLDLARNISNIPFLITSGWGCESHNKEVGGKKSSSHLHGLAVDITCSNDNHRWIIINSLMKVGITRIGIASNFIHCDMDRNKNQNRIWVY